MDYKNKNLEIIVELLKNNKISNIVISPGGTNIPFVRLVQEDPYFTCYSVVDERSAMYFAIGLYLRTGKPVVTSCTSAQATRNYIPGLTEAYYKSVPILAVTMSKHPRFTYQEYMQAPDQTSLPRDSIKKSFALPYISDDNDVYHSIRVTNEAILELTHNGYGPVQLCVPWLDFPLTPGNILTRTIKRFENNHQWNLDFNGKKILIIIGERRRFLDEEINLIQKFAEKTNTVIYTNHLSNFKGSYSVNGNLALSTMTTNEFSKKYLPDIVISIGGQTGDYPLYKMLSKTEFYTIEHWRVSIDGKVVDTYDKLTCVFQCEVQVFFDKVLKESTFEDKEEHAYYNEWKELVDHLSTDIPVPFSSVSIAQLFSRRIPKNSIIQFSILNSLRVWSLFQLDRSVSCFSNVGAFGIDGGLSTLIGQSMATDDLCFMVIGDLAFYYDMNSLGIRHIKNNVRILLINNNGGVEFKLADKEQQYLDVYIAAANHFKNAKGWSETCGFIYHEAHNMDELKRIANTFVEKSAKPQLLEVYVSDHNEAVAYNTIINKNKRQGFSSNLKGKIRSVIGEENAIKIKGILK